MSHSFFMCVPESLLFHKKYGTHMNVSYLSEIQGGVESENALSLQVVFRKRAL